MTKRLINESQLQYIIEESIKKILSESFDNSEKTLYAYDCDNPNGYKVIHTVNGTDFREIKAYIQKFLSEQIDWMDDEHLNDKDIDGAITNIAKSLVKKGESGFIYTYCFYLGNDVPKNNLNEAFRSSKLKKFAREHGGLAQGKWSASFDNDIYNMSDEEFDQYVPVNQDEHYRRYGLGGWDKNSPYTNNNFQPLEFKDGTFLVRKDPETAYGQKSKDLYRKRSDRYDAKKDDGAKEYQYENPYLHSIVNDTEFKPRGNWGFKGDGNLEKQNLNPRAIKQKHIFKTYGDDADKKADDLAAGKFKEKNDDKNIVNKTKNSKKP